jgi:hypothetical protein
MVVIPAFARPAPIDTPEQYESRCIVADAQRAAMMRDPIAKACFWRPGTRQYDLWVTIYTEALNG